jgi:RimJ/RimL family protein N-acetyltransferase
MNLDVPIIETERLRLRGHELRDFEASAAMWGDPDVARFIGGRPSTREETWARYLRYVGFWPVLGFGYWVIESKTDGRFLGEIGFADMKRELTPSFEGLHEHGWALITAAQGKGIASEAVAATLAWGERTFPRFEPVCMISPENAASIRLAEKFGYREFARTEYKGAPTVLFRRSV